MAKLSKEAMRLLSFGTQPLPNANQAELKAVDLSQKLDLLQRIPSKIANQSLTLPEQEILVSHAMPPLGSEPIEPSSLDYLIGLPNFIKTLLTFLLAVLLAWLVYWYEQQKTKQRDLASDNIFEPINITPRETAFSRQNGIDDVDFSLTQDGLSDSMSVTDLSQYDSLQVGADGELVMEQARIYAHIGRSEEAIELLQTHIDNKPKASLHHWLYLLDIYREANQKEAFTRYAALLHQKFNVMTPVWSDETVLSNLASTLEAFPHIVQQLTNLWNDEAKKVETQAYIEYLLTDNRDSVRTGFSMEVFQELILLNDILSLRDKFAEAVNV